MTHPTARLYDRLYKVTTELWKVRSGTVPGSLKIGDEEFDHEAWLEAEQQALDEKKDDIAATVAPDGSLVEDDSFLEDS